MHHPQRGRLTSRGNGQIHSYRGFTNVIGIETAGGPDEVQVAVKPVGVNEGHDTGYRRWLERRWDRYGSIEQLGRDTRGVGAPLEVNVLAGDDAGLSARPGKSSTPKRKRLTSYEDDLRLLGQWSKKTEYPLNFFGS